MPGFVVGKTLEKLKTLLSALMGSHTGMGFVDDDQGRTRTRKALSTAFSFNIIEADDSVGMGVEQRLGRGKPTFQSCGGSGCNCDCVKIELGV